MIDDIRAWLKHQATQAQEMCDFEIGWARKYTRFRTWFCLLNATVYFFLYAADVAGGRWPQAFVSLGQGYMFTCLHWYLWTYSLERTRRGKQEWANRKLFWMQQLHDLEK